MVGGCVVGGWVIGRRVVGGCVGGISFVPSVQFEESHSLASILDEVDSVSEVTETQIRCVSSSSVDRFSFVFGTGIRPEITMTLCF